MKLRIILEDAGGNDVEDVLEYLEEFVDTRKGKLTTADKARLTSYLGLFNDRYRKKIAAMLGTKTIEPAAMAAEIASGALIAYVDENDVPGFHDGNIPEPHDDAFDFVLPHHDEVEPSQQQLQNIESQGSGDGSYRNSPPALSVEEGGCPPLASLPPQTSLVLAKAGAAALIDYGFGKTTQPFIFIGGSVNKMLVGDEDGYHGDILSNIIDSKEARLARNVYHGGEFSDGGYVPGSAIPGVVGRVGYNLEKLDPDLQRASIVSFYAKEGSKNPADTKTAIELLLKGRYIPRDAYVNVVGKVSTAQEIVGGGQIEVSEQDRKRSELQAAYHVGTWPNGKRMTAQEKAALAKELGMSSAPMKKHPMQQAGENAGLLVPGQRWWAPTSESKETNG